MGLIWWSKCLLAVFPFVPLELDTDSSGSQPHSCPDARTLEGVIQRPAGWSFVWVLRSWRLLYTLMVGSVWSHLIPSPEKKDTLRVGTVSAIILWCPTCCGLIERATRKHQLFHVGTWGKRDPSLHFVLDTICVKTKSFPLPHLNTTVYNNELVSIARKYVCDTRGRGQSQIYEIWADTKYS